MGGWYWIGEFIRVCIAYGFIMYIWPSVVFRNHLRDKSRTYRFCFNVCMSILILNTGVLLLGLFHLLYMWLAVVLYMGVFLVQLYRNYHYNLRWLKDIKSVALRTLTIKSMLKKWINALWQKTAPPLSAWWESTKGHRLEYAVLIVILAFGTYYFSINALEVHSYGFGDSYVHLQWIYGLKDGEIFVKGIYPEAMHCVIYLASGLFGIQTYNAVLFFAGAHIHVYLISAYLLMKELFGWRMSAMFALVGFLVVDQLVINTVFGMSRLAWTIPQEFGMFTVYMVPCVMIRYLRQPKDEERLSFKKYLTKPLALFRKSTWSNLFRKGNRSETVKEKKRSKVLKKSGWLWLIHDENLLLFCISIAASIAIHFYAIIIAIYICAAIAVVNIRKMFERNKFIKMATVAIIGLFIAALPMAGAYATGHKLQGSLYWAIAVTRGGEEAWARGDYDANADYLSNEEDEEEEKLPLKDRIVKGVNDVIDQCYKDMYYEERGMSLIYATLGVTAFALLGLAVTMAVRLVQKLRKTDPDKRVRGTLFNSYLVITVSSVVLMIAYCPTSLGLPPIVAGTRVCSTAQMFAVMIYMCSLDAVFTLIHRFVKEWMLKPLSVAVMLGIYFAVRAMGMFHGFLYYELTRYPIAVELTKEITQNVEPYSFTIVSTTDELYQLTDYGYHEEWVDLLENAANKTYTLPTPYIFFFIEKQPIQYAQSSFASGPSWLAEEKYSYLWEESGSQYPYINHGTISEWFSQQPIDYGRKRADTANKLSSRQILESKAYEWYKTFSELHPNAGEVIYEDEDYICYCIKQNEYCVYTLGVTETVATKAK